MSQVAPDKFRDFTNGIDYLLSHIIDSADPEISKMRARLHIALQAVKGLTADGLGQAHAAAESTDAWVRKNPWLTIGIAAAAGALIGVMAARPRSR